MTETRELLTANSDVLDFVEKCDKLNYKNNNTLNAMRWDWVYDNGGTWYGTYDKGSIVGLSGVHQFLDGYRALYRGCQLYSIPGGLTKNHMNCWMFRYHLPQIIKRFPNSPIFITTNTDNDASGKMLKLNRLYKILEKRGLVNKSLEDEKLFGVNQIIWELNIDAYQEALRKV